MYIYINPRDWEMYLNIINNKKIYSSTLSWYSKPIHLIQDNTSSEGINFEINISIFD